MKFSFLIDAHMKEQLLKMFDAYMVAVKSFAALYL